MVNKYRSVRFAKPLIQDDLELGFQKTPKRLSSISEQSFNGTNSLAICRICYSGENSGLKIGEPLISPCNCKGTMGLYHRSCLKKWLVSSDTFACEICRFKFDIKKLKPSFWKYLKDDEAIIEHKTLYTDLLCFIFLTPLVFFSAIFCVSFAQTYTNSNEKVIKDHSMEFSIAMILFSFLLLIAYSIWLLMTIFFHQKCFQIWQDANPDFEVIDQLSHEESILINNQSIKYSFINSWFINVY